MPLFDSSLMRLTEKPTSDEYIEVTKELILRCMTEIDPNISRDKVLNNRLDEEGRARYVSIETTINSLSVFDVVSSLVIVHKDDNSSPIDRAIKLLSYDKK